jgi:hypothetical protein
MGVEMNKVVTVGMIVLAILAYFVGYRIGKEDTQKYYEAHMIQISMGGDEDTINPHLPEHSEFSGELLEANRRAVGE